MVKIEDMTVETLDKKRKVIDVKKLAKESFKGPFLIYSHSGLELVCIKRLPFIFRDFINIFTSSDKLFLYHPNYKEKVEEFAEKYKIKFEVEPTLQIDFWRSFKDTYLTQDI